MTICSSRGTAGRHQVVRNACHPRDLMDLVVTRARYEQRTPQLTLETMKAACVDYFGEA